MTEKETETKAEEVKVKEVKKPYEVSHTAQHPVTPFDAVYLNNRSHIEERHGKNEVN